jgi:hypothetical protein
MRSFRLDADSVTELLDSWPAFIIAPLLFVLFAYLGITHLWGRVCAVLIFGIFGGFMLRGVIARQFREQYPGARSLWLLTVGQTSAAVGVATMLAFPEGLNTPFNLSWLGISFFSILLFVIVNRKNRNVVR